MTLGKPKGISDLSLPTEKMGVVTLISLCGIQDFTNTGFLSLLRQVNHCSAHP